MLAGGSIEENILPWNEELCFGHTLAAGQSYGNMGIDIDIVEECCAYIVSVPHLDDLRIGRNDQIHLLMELNGVDGQAIVMVLHEQGARGSQVIQQNLQ